MGVYDRQIATALSMIQRRGQSVTWRKPGSSVPDPTQPWILIPGTPTDYTVSIVFLPVSRIGEWFQQYMTGTNIPEGAVIGYMGAVSFTPALTDIVIRSSKEYRIKYIEPIAPNGEIILYTMEFHV